MNTDGFKLNSPVGLKFQVTCLEVDSKIKVIITQPKVAILLCTYNGQDFLQEQLGSFLVQTHLNWVLYVSDDGSTDSTMQILGDFAKKIGEDRVVIFHGPRKGFATNFLSLIHHEEIEADYFSFADQDDVWLPEKLEVALNWLQQQPESNPALYCSRTLLIDAKGKIIGQSDLFSRRPSFSNALVQSIAGGNTMVLNRVARNLVSTYSPKDGIVSHDWWVYILVSGNDGVIKYDHMGYVLYRQHDGNLVGMNRTWMARVRRAMLLLRGHFKELNSRNICLILSNKDFLSEASFVTLEKFRAAREDTTNLCRRLILLNESSVYRQTFLGNLGLFIATCLNKL